MKFFHRFVVLDLKKNIVWIPTTLDYRLLQRLPVLCVIYMIVLVEGPSVSTLVTSCRFS
jgi:hypothetical protein